MRFGRSSNYVKKHTTIKTTPAVKASVTDHQWGMEELVELIDRHTADSLGLQKAFS